MENSIAEQPLFREAARWARWLAIAGFIFIAGLLYISFRAGYSWVTAPEADIYLSEMARLTCFSTLFGGIFLYFPFKWLLKFGEYGRKISAENSAAQVAIALAALRSLFRYLAIWLLIIIVLYGLFLAITAIASIMQFGKY